MTSQFFKLVSLHARLSSHYDVWSYKKKKKIKIIEESCLERTQGKNVPINSKIKAI